MATLATETWTGTTGAAWPAQWTTFSTGTGGTATIQANAGRLTSPVGSASYPSESAYLSGMTSTSDTDLLVSFRGTAAAVEQYVVIAVDVQSTATLASNNWMPSTGYALLLSYGPTASASAIDLYKPATNGFTSLQTAALTLTGTTQYTVRLQRIGSAVRARIWATGGAEPGTWNIDYTDASPLAAGKVRLTAVSGTAAAARSFDFDDLTVTDGVAGPAAVAAPLAGSGALTVTASPVASRSVALAGSGALSAALSTKVSDWNPAATWNNAATWGAEAAAPVSVAGALSGSGALTAAITPKLTVSGPISGSGVLSATAAKVGVPTVSAPLAGSGTLAAATQVSPTTRSVALSGAGSLSAAITKPPMTASFSGSGQLTAVSGQVISMLRATEPIWLGSGAEAERAYNAGDLVPVSALANWPEAFDGKVALSATDRS